MIIAWFKPYRPLLATLILVYCTMAGLSAIDMQGEPLAPSKWQWDTPRFILEEQRSTAADGLQTKSYAFNRYNQRKILEQAAINLTLGVGMTFVILTGGIDLSVGSLLALCNVIFVDLIRRGGGGIDQMALAMGACVFAGMLCGVGNGWLAVTLRIPSFIVTLGTLLVVRGLAFWVSGGETKLYACPQSLAIAIPIGVSIVAVVAASIFLGATAGGRQIYAVGGNLLASQYSGVRTGMVRMLCFAFSGLCAGLAGMIYWSRTSTGSYTAGEGAELYAIAAVVLGGTRLAGGEGTIFGTLIGALIMSVLANGLNTAGVHELTQKIIVGCVLIAAAYIDSRRGRRGNIAIM